jgi:hypothetical protein
METAFKQANYEGGVVSSIPAVTQHLMKHFPSSSADRNELPDNPVVLWLTRPLHPVTSRCNGVPRLSRRRYTN